MEITPSKYQTDIFDFIQNSTKNAVISAVAGSGKTTTLLLALEKIPQDKTVLFMAFNKSIAEELKKRVPDNNNISVTTVHGFGYSTLRNRKSDIEIDNSKYRKILKAIFEYIKTNNKEALNEYKFDFSHKSYINSIKKLLSDRELNTPDFIKNVIDLCELGRLHYVNIDDKLYGIKNIKELSEIHLINNEDNECDVAWYLIKLGLFYIDKIDFTDMIFLPNILNLKTKTFDYVFIDECQDISICHRLLMIKAMDQENGKFIAVGDPHQCQPKGAKILLSNGTYENIENIKIGDKVVSYDNKNKGFFIGFYKNHRWGYKSMEKYGYNVNNINKREYNGIIITVISNDKQSQYTPNHKSMVRFKKELSKYYALYLMKKNGLFRIGITSLWTKNNNFASFRAKQEDADSFWVLNIYKTQHEAYLDEQFYSLRFSIPQMRFKHRNQKGILNQELINNFYEKVNKNQLYNNAIQILKFFNRDIDYPIWKRDGKNYFSKNHMFEINTCNLIPLIMEVPIFDENNISFVKRNKSSNKNLKIIKPIFQAITEIKYENYNGIVYSLEVDKYELYVADDILTHNSIYGFAGADHKSYQKLCELPNTVQLPLSITYRCHSQIVDMVKHINPDIFSLPENNNGEIIYNYSYKNIEDGDMILCRQTLPVVSLCVKYLSMSKRAYIIGGDIGLSLKNMIKSCERKTENFTMTNVFNRLYNEMEKMITKIMENHSMSRSEAVEDNHIISYNEKILAIEELSQNIEDPNEVIKKIEDIFSNDDKSGICLSTIHKAKGLESNRVFILQPELMPSKKAILNWQIAQEQNLFYVAYTRAKTVLGFITDYDAFKNHKSRRSSIGEVKESKHVGIIGTKEYLNLKIVDVRNIKTTYGDTVIYDMVDKKGNVFTKFGEIRPKFLRNYGETEVKAGSEVSFLGEIKSHTEFRGTKITTIGKIK